MSVSIEREVIFLLETPEMQLQGERIALAERTEIFKSDDQYHPLEIHVAQFKGFKRERGVVFYLTPEMIRAIQQHAVCLPLPFDEDCTRPPHNSGPCNGLPRKDCPGYASWVEGRVKIESRPDGGIRVSSPDMPGLILSGPNRKSILAAVAPAIEALLKEGNNLDSQPNYNLMSPGFEAANTRKETKPDFNFKNFKDDKRPFVEGKGWAPGSYTCVCGKCKASFMGEKRATECADCAYGTPPAISKEKWNALSHRTKGVCFNNYRGWPDVPALLPHQRAIIKVHYEDARCSHWIVWDGSYVYDSNHRVPELPTQYPYRPLGYIILEEEL